MARITKSTEYIRHNFTPDERLTMGSELAEAHNRLADIDAEESVIKAQIKERRAGIEQKVGTLSREIATGFTMKNIDCKLVYDLPNVGEVSYVRLDNGEVAKVRPMTVSERQQEIEFVPPAPVEKSEEAIADFFDKPAEETTITQVTVEEALMLNDMEPHEARQTLLTMGDAKKSRKKKSAEAQFDPTYVHPQPDMDPDDSMPF